MDPRAHDLDVPVRLKWYITDLLKAMDAKKHKKQSHAADMIKELSQSVKKKPKKTLDDFYEPQKIRIR